MSSQASVVCGPEGGACPVAGTETVLPLARQENGDISQFPTSLTSALQLELERLQAGGTRWLRGSMKNQITGTFLKRAGRRLGDAVSWAAGQVSSGKGRGLDPEITAGPGGESQSTVPLPAERGPEIDLTHLEESFNAKRKCREERRRAWNEQRDASVLSGFIADEAGSDRESSELTEVGTTGLPPDVEKNCGEPISSLSGTHTVQEIPVDATEDVHSGADGLRAKSDAIRKEPGTLPGQNSDCASDMVLRSVSYSLPTEDLLRDTEEETAVDPETITRCSEIIQRTIDSFGIDAEVGNATPGPRVTLYEVAVAMGVKVEAITRIANNLAMELAAVSLRILAPVPGCDYVGIEVPNEVPATVPLGAMIHRPSWYGSSCELPLAMGRSIRGEDIILDLAKAPHVLVAGATGSGKSVCLNSMLISLLHRFTPAEMRLILVDPKVVEFSVYNSLPHLIVPVVTEVANVVLALRWLVREMERRYRILAAVGARNLATFNRRDTTASPAKDTDGIPIPERLPHIVLAIDELADIMMSAREDVEKNLARIAQMSRAVGIHTIIATQRPSVNIITGVIKANYPTRVAFQVSSQIDSRTIIDGKGAEALLGRGDMLFKPPGAAAMQRLQGTFVTDGEIEDVVAFCAAQDDPDFDLSVLKPGADMDGAVEVGSQGEEIDSALIREAMGHIIADRRASTSYIQRRLKIGYNRAASIMDSLEQRGYVGPQIGSVPREILIDEVPDG